MARRLVDSTRFNIIALGVLAVAVTVALVLAINAWLSTLAFTHKLQDGLCGLVTPIGQQQITSKTTGLGKTLILGGRHATVVISCPAPKGR